LPKAFQVSVMKLDYEIREQVDPEGGLRLALLVEGKQIATAGAGLNALDAMAQLYGLDREAVAADLRERLRELLKHQLDQVSVKDVTEEVDRPLRFHARYTCREAANHVDTGTVWYDVNTSDTGPDELPAIIRNKMRLEVHRKLTSQGSAARALVDLCG